MRKWLRAFRRRSTSLGTSLSLLASLMVAVSIQSQPSANSTFAAYDYAFDFAGPPATTTTLESSSDKYVIPQSSNESFTVEAWLYLDRNTTNWQAIAVQNQSDSGLGTGRVFFGLNYQLRFHVGLGSSTTDSSYQLPIEQWKHVALTVTNAASDNTKIYVDGDLKHTATLTIGNRTSGSTHEGFSIGTNTSGGFQIDGKIDQVKIWSGALSGSQILQSMHTYASEGISGVTLRAHYDFNDATSLNLNNQAGDANYNLTVTKAGTSNFIESTYAGLNLNAKIGTPDNGTWLDQLTQTNVSTTPQSTFPSWSSTNKFFSFASGNQIYKNVSFKNPRSFSIEIWFKTRQVSAKIIGFQNDAGRSTSATSYDRHLYVDENGKLRFGLWNNGAGYYAVSDASVNDGNWHHAVATYAGGTTMNLYLDKVKVTTTNISSSTQDYTGKWIVGGGNLTSWRTGVGDSTYSSSGPDWIGQLAIARVTSIVMTDSQVNSSYQSAADSQTLTLSFDADGGSGTMNDQQVMFGTATGISTNSFSKTGYNFSGWATSAGGAVSYANAAQITMLADLTLYAKWSLLLSITTPSEGLTGTLGSAFTLNLISTGGSGGNSFAVATGTLPSGLTLDSSSGAISGTPTSAGSSEITVRVTDSSSATATTSSFRLVISCPPNSSIVSSGLVLHLDAGSECATSTSGIWRDISGKSRDLSWVGSAPTRDSTYGGFYEFIRTSSHYGTFSGEGLNDFTNGFTISFYARFDATGGGGWERIIDFGNGTNSDNIIVGREGSTSRLILELRRGGTETLECSADIITDSEWAHFAITVEPNVINANSACKIYKNGTPQLDPYINHPQSQYLPINMSRSFNYLGESNWGNDAYFDGGIGDVAIYNRALSADEITTNFQSQRSTSVVTFNANGGSGSMDNQSVGSGVLTNLTANSFTRAGYTFYRWATASNGTGTTYTDAQAVSLSSNTTLYAQWNGISYTITYNANSSTSGTAPNSGTYTSGGAAYTINSNTGNLKRSGYHFAGWNTAADGSGIDYAATGNVTYSTSIDLTLYAKWTRALYTVTFNNNHDNSTNTLTHDSGGTVILPSPTRTGHVLNGWYSANSGGIKLGDAATTYTPLNKTKLILRYELDEPNSYAGSGTTLNDIASSINSEVSGQKDLTFDGSPTFATSDGMYVNLASASSQYIITESIQDRVNGTSISVFAWIYPTGNGVVVSEIGQSAINTGWHDSQIEIVNGKLRFNVWNDNYRSSYVESDSITLNSWQYVGFTYDATSKTLRAFINGVSVASRTNLTRLAPATLFYAIGAADSTNQGNGGYGNFRLGAFHVYNAGLTETQALLNYQGSCVRFIANCTQQTLYAQWTPTATVAFDANGGSGSMSSQVRQSGVATALTTNAFTRAGFTFVEWTTAADGSGTAYSNAQSVAISQDVTLYAQWTKILTTNLVVNLDATNLQSLATNSTAWKSVRPGTSASTQDKGGNVAYKSTGGIVSLTFDGSGDYYEYTDVASTRLSGPISFEMWINPGELRNGWNILATRWFSDTSGGGTSSTSTDWHFAIRNNNNQGLRLNLYTTEATDKYGSRVFAASDEWILVGFTIDSSNNLKFYVNGVQDGSTHENVTHTNFAAAKFFIGDPRANMGFPGDISKVRLYGAALSDAEMLANFDAEYLYYRLNKVTFNENYGASPATSTQILQRSTATNLTVNSFTRTNFNFNGWNTAADGSGTNYSNSQSVTLTEDLTLYAKWNTATYAVSYDSQGGTPIASGTFTQGGAIANSPGTPVRAGYTFNGWFAGSSGGSALTFPYSPGVNQAITLYAQWSVVTYTVTYDSQGGSDISSGSYATGGNIANSPGSPTRSGYTFNGWFVAATGGTAITFPYTPGLTRNLTIYAQWTAINYNITYSSNEASSGTVPIDGTNYNIGQKITVRANTGVLARTGYTFAGWNTAADGSGTTYLSGTEYTVGSANVTLFAKWNAVTYTITYNTNGASGNAQRSNANVTSDSYTTGGATVTLPGVGTMAKTGHDFGGWSETTSGAAVSDNLTTTSNKTLYARWTLQNIAVNFSKGIAAGENINNFPADTTMQYGSTLTLNSTLTSTVVINGSPHVFVGWSYNSSIYQGGSEFLIGTASPTFTAEWVKVFAVRYSFSGGTPANNSSEVDGECLFQDGNDLRCTENQVITSNAAPSRTGYTFSGWIDQTGAAVATASQFTVTSQRYLLYAQWTPVNYTITYEPNSGATTPTQANRQIGQTFTVADAISRTGYSFNGWSDGTRNYGPGATYTVGSANVTLTAQWIADVYTITYDWNGGRGSAEADASYTVGTGALTLPLVGDRVKDGYTFSGWSLTPSGDLVELPYTPTQSITLYAIWGTGSYTLTFNANGGTNAGGTDSAQIQNGSSTTLPTPTRSNFVFDGWYSAATGGTLVGAAGASYQPTQSRSIYARWTQASLAGLSPSVLTRIGTTTTSNGVSTSFSGANPNSAVSISIPADALPAGTVVNFDLVGDVSRARTAISNANSYIVSIVVSWLATDGSVPDTAPGKPIAVTIQNAAIKAGASVYKIIFQNGQSVPTFLATATQDGIVTVNITTDPEVVVAVTKPEAPTSVSATSNGNLQSVISWSAPASNGGAPITSYTATANTGESCQTATLTCTITGLSAGTGYTFTVTATNSQGTSDASSSASATTASSYTVTFNSNGGSDVASVSFLTGGSISAPANPSRSGFTFAGWSETDGGGAVLFDYSPGVNQNITLYALWTAIPTYTVTFDSNSGSAVTDGSFSAGGSVTEPSAPTRSGFTFAGWAATNGGSAVTFPYSPGVSQNITLYAKWTEVVQNSGGGSGSGSSGGGSGNSGGSSSSRESNRAQGSGGSKPSNPTIVKIKPVEVIGSSQAKIPTVELPINDQSNNTSDVKQERTVKVTGAEAKITDSVKIIDNQLVIVPVEGFSGKRTITVSITEGGEVKTIEIPLVVLPEPVKAPVVLPTSARRTTIDWKASPNADKYEVFVNGKRVCSTSKTECTINQLIGPGAQVEIISNGGDRTRSEAAPADYEQKKPIQVARLSGSTRIKPTLSSLDEKLLNDVIALIKKQGFGTVIISDVTTSRQNREAATKRIAAIKDYIGERVGEVQIEFRVIEPSRKTFLNTVSLGE